MGLVAESWIELICFHDIGGSGPIGKNESEVRHTERGSRASSLCETHGKARQDSRGVGVLVRDCSGELTALLSEPFAKQYARKADLAHNPERQPSRKDHDSERADCVCNDQHECFCVSLRSHESTHSPRSSLNIQDVPHGHEDKASELPVRIYRHLPPMLNNSGIYSACISDTAPNDREIRFPPCRARLTSV